jgi:hypothetical protein
LARHKKTLTRKVRVSNGKKVKTPIDTSHYFILIPASWIK